MTVRQIPARQSSLPALKLPSGALTRRDPDYDFDPELSPLGGEEPTNDRRRDAAGPEADDAESGVAGSPSDTSGDGDTNGSASTGGDAGNSSAGRRGPQGGN